MTPCYKYIGPKSRPDSRKMILLYEIEDVVLATDAAYLHSIIGEKTKTVTFAAIRYKKDDFYKWYEKMK